MAGIKQRRVIIEQYESMNRRIRESPAQKTRCYLKMLQRNPPFWIENAYSLILLPHGKKIADAIIAYGKNFHPKFYRIKPFLHLLKSTIQRILWKRFVSLLTC